MRCPQIIPNMRRWSSGPKSPDETPGSISTAQAFAVSRVGKETDAAKTSAARPRNMKRRRRSRLRLKIVSDKRHARLPRRPCIAKHVGRATQGRKRVFTARGRGMVGDKRFELLTQRLCIAKRVGQATQGRKRVFTARGRGMVGDKRFELLTSSM